MKHAVQILYVVAIIGFIMSSPVIAATSQGFEWGVEKDDQFNFTMSITTQSDTMENEEFYLVVNDTPIIPNIVNEWKDIPFLNIEGYWKNGTSMGFMIIILFLAERLAVPIGNYSLLSEIIDAEAYHESVDGSLFWGFNNEIDSPSGKTTISVQFLKEDGFLARYSAVVKNGTETINEYTVERLGLPSESSNIIGLITDNALYIGAGIVIIGAVYCLVSRRK